MIDPPLARRRLLLALTALPALTRAGSLLAAPSQGTTTLAGTVTPFAEKPRLLVAGPQDGALNLWADALLPALEQSLPPDTSIQRVEVGSADGVTGANQFEVRGVPDGMTVLLAPGEAALAWMVGDPRAQFDVGHWVPVLAGTASAVVVVRPSTIAKNSRVRVAAASPVSVDLAALLALDLLGVPLEPVFGLADSAAARSAFAKGDVDAVFLHGQHVPDQVNALVSVGAQTWFTLGSLDEAGRPLRDPAFTDVPHFKGLLTMRLGRAPNGALYDAWCAVAAAAQLDFGLVLQQLTPAGMVALWRRAGADAVASQGLQVTSTALGVRLLAGSDATAGTSATAASAATLTELRRWLSNRLNWRPA
jgi:hypothetical protein